MSSNCVLCSGIQALPSVTCKAADSGECDVCAKLADLATEIEDARHILAQLVEDRRKVEIIANQRHDPVTRLLPSEIVSHIFVYAHKHTEPVPTFHNVSRQWRRIAISTPQLWTTISFAMRPTKYYPRLEHVQELLRRSGELPLSICVTYVGYHPASVSARHWSFFRSALNVLTKSSYRWKHLEFSLPPPLFSFLCGDSSGRSILQLLHVDGYGDDTTERTVQSFMFMMNTRPAPTRLILENVSADSLLICWDNITHFEAHSIRLEDCAIVFHNYARLEEFTVRGILCGSAQLASCVKPIVVENLKRMEFHRYRWNDFKLDRAPETLFDHIELPSLEYLYADLDQISTQSLTSMFKRSSPPKLQTLAITNVPSDALLIQLLRALSCESLVELEIDMSDGELSDEFFDLLGATAIISRTELSAGKGFLPHLRQLTLQANQGFLWDSLVQIFQDSDIVTELDYHHMHRRPLSKFYITVTDHFHKEDAIDEDVYLALRELMDKGGVEIPISDGGFGDLLEEAEEIYPVSDEEDDLESESESTDSSESASSSASHQP